MYFEQIVSEGLGCFSYVAGCRARARCAWWTRGATCRCTWTSPATTACA
jgi:hypothetical protein